jgi:hypothetical protein
MARARWRRSSGLKIRLDSWAFVTTAIRMNALNLTALD